MKPYLMVLIAVFMLSMRAADARAFAEEELGNRPLNYRNYPAQLKMMPAIDDLHRVYRVWVNGNENFDFAGNTDALNAALQTFAQITAKTHEVVLTPGPAATASFDKKTISYNWDIHFIGGIAGADFKGRDMADLIWNPDPVLTIHLGGAVDLAALQIPPNISVISVSDLATRFRKALHSSDSTVRGWGCCGDLMDLDIYDQDSVAAVTSLLKDGDNWVRENAALALAGFGAEARSALPALNEQLNSPDIALQRAARQTILSITQSKADPVAEQQHRRALDAIKTFCAPHSPPKDG